MAAENQHGTPESPEFFGVRWMIFPTWHEQVAVSYDTGNVSILEWLRANMALADYHLESRISDDYYPPVMTNIRWMEEILHQAG